MYNNFNQSNSGFPKGAPKEPLEPGKIVKTVLVIFAVIAAIALVSTCWYTVNDNQQAVITTFGKVTSTSEAGIHFKLPFGIQNVDLVDVYNIQKIEIGYSSKGETVESESKMITGDFNIVNVDFFVEYKISDPIKYLYSAQKPALILKSLAQSQIRNVIGSFDVDSVLTNEKTAIQMQIKELIIEELEEYDIGLSLLAVMIQDAEPPTEQVNQAFKNVETARQGMETAINDANAYKNQMLPDAVAKADKLIQNAEYLKQNRINEAVKQVAMFEAMFSEYALNSAITKSRMYFEAMEAVLPGVKVIIDTSSESSDINKLLPIDKLS